MNETKIFVSYSHQNSDWVDEDGKYRLIPWLKNQLKRDGVFFWTDHALAEHVGERYEQKIRENIAASDIALLLISQEFAASDFILDRELPWIREAFDGGRIKIIPLLIDKLSKKGKKDIAWLFDLQTIPNDVKPVIDYYDRDNDWSEIRITILDAIMDKIEALRTPSSTRAAVSPPDKPAQPPPKRKPDPPPPPPQGAVEREREQISEAAARKQLKRKKRYGIAAAVILLVIWFQFMDFVKDLTDRITRDDAAGSEKTEVVEKSGKSGMEVVEEDGKYGFVNTKTGQKIAPQYDEVNRFREDLAGVSLDGKWGFINKKGEMMIPFRYDDAGAFAEGRASVQLNGKWGYVDKVGREVIPPIYDKVEPFTNGMALVILDGKWFFIDKAGNRIEWINRFVHELDTVIKSAGGK
jgi:hypothetical protein